MLDTGTSTNRLSSRAFSLVELLVVVAVIAVAAGIAIPRTASAVASHRIDTTAAETRTLIELAREQAKSTSTSVRLTFSREPQQLSLTVIDPTTAQPVNVGDLVPQAETLDATDHDAIGHGPGATPDASTQHTRTACRAALLSLHQDVGTLRKTSLGPNATIADLAGNVAIVASVSGGGPLLFNGHGHPSADTQIQLSLGRHHRTLTIDRITGQITIEH